MLPGLLAGWQQMSAEGGVITRHPHTSPATKTYRQAGADRKRSGPFTWLSPAKLLPAALGHSTKVPLLPVPGWRH